jgi:hypothetical protein
LIGREEYPIGALLQQDKSLLKHSTHGWEATSDHQSFGKGMLIF